MLWGQDRIVLIQILVVSNVAPPDSSVGHKALWMLYILQNNKITSLPLDYLNFPSSLALIPSKQKRLTKASPVLSTPVEKRKFCNKL
jgi:hypothetical protein